MSGAGLPFPTEIVSAPGPAASSSSYPPCAETCLANATGSLPCAETDSACLCLHASNVQNSVTSCLAASNACSTTDASLAAAYYNRLCPSLGFATTQDQLPSAGPILTASAPPTPVSTSLPSATTSETTTASQHHTLPVPAIVGIAAGGAFLIVCIITSLIYCYFRRKSSKGSVNPVVTIESPDPADPNSRLRQTVSLRQSALYDLDNIDEKLSHVRSLSSDDEKYSSEHYIEHKKSLAQTPRTPISRATTLTNNSFTYSKEDFNAPLPALPAPVAPIPFSTLSQRPNPPAYTYNRPPSITFLPSKSLFEASVTSLSLPASRRVSYSQKSPAVTVFSDAASICEASDIDTHSRSASHITVSDFGLGEQDVEVARASTLMISRSRPTTFEARAEPPYHRSSIANALNHDNNDTLTTPPRPISTSRFSTSSAQTSFLPIQTNAISTVEHTSINSSTSLSTAFPTTPITSSYTYTFRPPSRALATSTQAPSSFAHPQRPMINTSLPSTRPFSPLERPSTAYSRSSHYGIDLDPLPKGDHTAPSYSVRPSLDRRQSQIDRRQSKILSSSFGKFDFELADRNGGFGEGFDFGINR